MSGSQDRPAAVGVEFTGRGATARAQVASQLRERILVGQLKGGTRINLDAIAAEFGVSRTPVREACLALAHDGLVEIAPRSAVTVRSLSPETANENFAIMSALSALAAGWAAERITPRELDRIRELHVEAAIAVRNGRDAGTATWMFHREVNRACKSPRMLETLASAARLIPRTLLDFFPQHALASIDEHAALVDALAARDPSAAAAMTRQHFGEIAELIRERITILVAEAKGRSAADGS